jgi:hypothetical protein
MTEYYKISKETIKKVQEALGNNYFTSTEDGDYNNDDVIEADELLTKEVDNQS